MNANRSQCFSWTYNFPDGEIDGDDREDAVIAALAFVEYDPKARYVVFQMERGHEDGRLHLQGFLEMRERVRLPYLHERWPLTQSWFKVCWHPKGAEDYAMKEDTRVEGPWTAGQRGIQGKSSKLADACEMVRGGSTMMEIATEFPTVFALHSRGLYSLQKELQPLNGEFMERSTMLYYGPTGLGKSRGARSVFRGEPYYNKPKNKWFDFYSGQKNVIFDDYGAGWAIPLAELLGLLDCYDDVLVETKGAFVKWAAKNIIFTSNQHPYFWYKWEGRELELPALARRFSKVVVFEEGGVIKMIEDKKKIENFFKNTSPLMWEFD